MKKLFALILATLMVATLFAACGANAPANDGGVSAATPTNASAEAQTIVVGYTIYEPMNYFDENNKLVGYDTELAEAVSAIWATRSSSRKSTGAASTPI